jgi:hypothetical protein
MTIMALSEEPARANAEGCAFSTKTNVHGITTCALLVSIRLREYLAKKAATADRPFAAAALDAELTSSRRSSTGDAIPLPLRDLECYQTWNSGPFATAKTLTLKHQKKNNPNFWVFKKCVKFWFATQISYQTLTFTCWTA